MEEILKSNLIYQISITCAILLPLLLISKMYRLVKFKEYTRANFIYIISYLVVLILIFALVFTNYQRTFLGVFLSLFVIIILLVIFFQKVFNK